MRTKSYSEGETTQLNYEIVSTQLDFGDASVQLNFDPSTTVLNFGEAITCLNYELRDYDQFSSVYTVLIDFLEVMGYGDIFTV